MQTQKIAMTDRLQKIQVKRDVAEHQYNKAENDWDRALFIGKVAAYDEIMKDGFKELVRVE